MAFMIEGQDTQLQELAALCRQKNAIDPALYQINNVQRGLRDKDGNGVKAGLTQVSTIISSQTIDGEKHSCPGVLRCLFERIALRF